MIDIKEFEHKKKIKKITQERNKALMMVEELKTENQRLISQLSKMNEKKEKRK